MKYNLKWQNKFSGETGYVGKVLKSKGYFVNAPKKENAKKYASIKATAADMEFLKEIGETENNNFSTEEA